MKLKPGCEVEYEKRHRAIWPELVKLLKETGVSEYSIFWDKETNLLFAVQEQAGDSGSLGRSQSHITRRRTRHRTRYTAYEIWRRRNEVEQSGILLERDSSGIGHRAGRDKSRGEN